MFAQPIALQGDQLIPLLERKRLFDGAWLVCLVASLASVAALWFLSVLEIDLGRVSWWVFVYTAIYLMTANLTDKLTSVRALVWAMRAKVMANTLFLGMFWHLVGGLKNPMFLLAFSIPVIVSGVMGMGLHAHLTAALSILVVTIVAGAESPGLRWYLERLHLQIPDWFVAAGANVRVPVQLFPGVVHEPAYEFTLVATFSFMQLILAFLSTPLTMLLLRINGRFETSKQMLGEVQGLFHAVLRAEPEPGVIIYADSGQIVQASDSFFQRMMLRPSQLMGKGLFEVVAFDDPGAVRKALEKPYGEIPFCVYHIDQEMRIANISFYRTEHGGTAYRYLGWKEVTDVYYLRTAFSAVHEPLMIIGKSGQLNYANEAARELFGALHFGMDCHSLPAVAELLEHGTSPAVAGSQEMRHEVNGTPYAVNRLIAPLPGGGEACTILWLRCIAREEALFDQAVKDPLTGIYNRRYFDEVMAGHVERSHRGQRVTLACFDLDDFKGINDTLGHAAGDAALRAFVGAVKSQLRDTDVFARRGGDEFAVLFVDCDTDVVLAALARLREVLDSSEFAHDGQAFAVHFSAGVATCRAGESVDQLVDRADRALYNVKEAGKASWGVAQ